jgi:hypothetical protein
MYHKVAVGRIEAAGRGAMPKVEEIGVGAVD